MFSDLAPAELPSIPIYSLEWSDNGEGHRTIRDIHEFANERVREERGVDCALCVDNVRIHALFETRRERNQGCQQLDCLPEWKGASFL